MAPDGLGYVWTVRRQRDTRLLYCVECELSSVSWRIDTATIANHGVHPEAAATEGECLKRTPRDFIGFSRVSEIAGICVRLRGDNLGTLRNFGTRSSRGFLSNCDSWAMYHGRIRWERNAVWPDTRIPWGRLDVIYDCLLHAICRVYTFNYRTYPQLLLIITTFCSSCFLLS